MSVIKDLSKFPKYGITGIVVLLIALVALFGYGYYKITSNHIDHNTTALGDVKAVIQGNTEVIRANTQAINNLLLKD